MNVNLTRCFLFFSLAVATSPWLWTTPGASAALMAGTSAYQTAATLQGLTGAPSAASLPGLHGAGAPHHHHHPGAAPGAHPAYPAVDSRMTRRYGPYTAHPHLHRTRGSPTHGQCLVSSKLDFFFWLNFVSLHSHKINRDAMILGNFARPTRKEEHFSLESEVC